MRRFSLKAGFQKLLSIDVSNSVSTSDKPFVTALTVLLSPNLASGQAAPNFQILCLYCSTGADDILYYPQEFISAIFSVPFDS